LCCDIAGPSLLGDEERLYVCRGWCLWQVTVLVLPWGLLAQVSGSLW
jgi:hypothetical protein